MKKITNKKSVWLIAMMMTAIADAAAVLAEPADFRMGSFYWCSTCAVSRGEIFRFLFLFITWVPGSGGPPCGRYFEAFGQQAFIDREFYEVPARNL